MGKARGLLLLIVVAAAALIAVRGGWIAGDGTATAGAEAAVPPGLEVDAAPGPADPGMASSAAPAPEPRSATTTQADPQDGKRILVSIDRRRLWLVDGRDTLLTAPVAVGMSQDFTYNGRRYHFATPRGTRRVLAKVPDPVWVVPEWHYYEKAERMGIPEVVKLDPKAEILLSDSSLLVVRDGQAGRVNHFGNFAPFTPGTEIIFDDRLYIPPMSTAQRRVPNALGPYKLDTGDGYLIHGTHPYNEESIGEAVSHGCVRMSNEDITRLYPLVPRGTPVIIY